MAVLCLAQIASTVDRGMLALVVDPVRADLGIDDMQIAWLQGFAFAVFYVSVGLPLGYVADRLNRRWLLVAGILVWSAATIGSGLARGFGDLFVGRLIVGVGEAVLGPCAVGMIGEMFPAHRRGRPMALYVLGSMVAYGLGAAATGQILQAAPQGAFAGVPLLSALAPWRVAFVLMGAIGVPVAVLLALLGQAARSRGVAQARSGGVWAAMSARWRVLVPLYGSLALFAMGAAAA
ncbi:MAG TPA: MFS transporter, partial [Novosphingobium sp.]|nr:MFS transporter [Novosphingobium sp.]